MICETCHGSGIITIIGAPVRQPLFMPQTCPECGGCGVAHCCEGDRPDCAAIEAEKDDDE